MIRRAVHTRLVSEDLGHKCRRLAMVCSHGADGLACGIQNVNGLKRVRSYTGGVWWWG